MGMVLIDSREACQPAKLHLEDGRTADVWVSRHGRVFGDREAAAYDGATHARCKGCAEPVPKGYRICHACAARERRAKWQQMEAAEWVEGPLYSAACDEFFDDEDALRDYLVEHELTLDDLELQLCRPVHLHLLEEDHWADELPEDSEAPQELLRAIDAFNALVEKLPPVCWEPTLKRAMITCPVCDGAGVTYEGGLSFDPTVDNKIPCLHCQ